MNKIIIIIGVLLLFGCDINKQETVEVPHILYQNCCIKYFEGEMCHLCYKKEDMKKWIDNK